ncbi:MAG: SxtJ family membrane protein [Candidatus Binatia bacterium]
MFTAIQEITRKQLRSFGLTVGGIFALIALWPVAVRAEDPRWWALVLALCLVLPAAMFPRSLVWPYRAWMALGFVLGWINTRIILGVLFFLVVTPIGAVRRWLGKDPMGRKLRPDLDSYRIARQPRPSSHFTRQY